MEAAATEEQKTGQEQLKTMSFGDHLEELRRRLGRSLVAIFVCVLALLPFKEEVTAIYTKPYRDMWMQGFVEYADDLVTRVEEMRQVVATATGSIRESEASSLVLYEEKLAFIREHRAAIENGTFPFADHGDLIRNRGGYPVSYHLVATRPIEDFWTFMAASALMSALVAGPFVIYQLWSFIAAGLYRNERRAVLRYVPGAVILLLGGVSFGYLVVVPYGLYFLVQLMNFGQVQPMVSVSNYFSLLFMLTAALGLVFQLPLVMLTLQKSGIVTHEAFIKNWRYVVLGMFVAAAVFTPPDPFTQAMMAGPMLVLYLFGLVLTGRSAKRARALEAVGNP